MSEVDSRVAKLEDEIRSIMSRPTFASTPAWHQEVAELRLAVEEIRTGKRAHSAPPPLPIRAPEKPLVNALAAAPAIAAVAVVDDHGGDHHVEPNYMAVFVWLTLFTLIELGLVQIIHGIPLAIGLTAFAIAKVLLVAFYYMHLRWENKLIHALLMIPVILVVIMIVLLIPDATTVLDGYFSK